MAAEDAYFHSDQNVGVMFPETPNGYHQADVNTGVLVPAATGGYHQADENITVFLLVWGIMAAAV